MFKKDEKMATVKLSSVIWRRFEEETEGIEWKGTHKTTKAEKEKLGEGVTVSLELRGFQRTYTNTKSM